ncbi:MAG: glycerol-3-phosphate dehydrogenase [Candidatus Hepatoplasma vulgare]|nr:MAG: glycerol-3-phosphate dehydrogenase [Candidatus Hepatoplasma sp.]
MNNKNNAKIYDILIIGGGIIGISIAKEFIDNKKSVFLVEKDPKILQETSSHNSGVIHGGFDATPGTLKAKFNVEGRHLYEKLYFKKETSFLWQNSDSYILAFDKEEEEELEKLYNQGIKNGLKAKEMAIISREDIFKVNPYINKDVKKALVCYTSKSINPQEFGNFLFLKAKEKGLEYSLNFKVNEIFKKNDYWIVKSEDGTKIKAKFIVNASGVWAEEIAKLVEKNPKFKIKTRRGQYLIIDKTQRKYTTNDIFFLTPTRHGKGVIVAPLFDGRVLVGPTAEDNVPKDDIQIVSERVLKSIKKIGRKINWKINFDRIETVAAGSRAINELTNDFYIDKSEEVDNFFHVAGIQSPGLSSAPAIAIYVYKKYLEFKK